jgi:outer membrane protein assembly factor BamB
VSPAKKKKKKAKKTAKAKKKPAKKKAKKTAKAKKKPAKKKAKKTAKAKKKPAKKKAKKTAKAKKKPAKKKAKKTAKAKKKPAKVAKKQASPKARSGSARRRRPKVLFVPAAEDRQVPTGLSEWLPDWVCAGGMASRTAYIRQRLRDTLDIDWRAKLGARAGHPPVVSQDGLVYVADREGGLHAFDAESGARSLELKTAAITEGSPVFPLVAQGLVPAGRVPICAPPLLAGWQLLFGDDEGIFYCVRRGDGRCTWRKSATHSFAARKAHAYQAPLEANGIAYTADAEGNLYGVDIRSGKTKLSLYLRGRPTAPPALMGNCLFVATRPIFSGEASRLHAIELDGTRRWHRDLPAQPSSVLTVNRETVFVGGDFGVQSFSVANGQPNWVAPLDGRKIVGNAALGLSELHVTSTEDVLTLELRTGAVRWWRRVGSKGIPGIVRAASELWGTSAGTLLAWDAKTGDPAARIPVPGTVVGGPVVALNRLFVATESGELIAYR